VKNTFVTFAVLIAMLLAVAGVAEAETTAECTGHTVLNVITN